MRIIISPAKKMNMDTDSLPVRDLPAFLEETEELCRVLQSKSPEELQKLWKCSDQIASLNVERLRQMDLRRNLTPAVLAYEGIQYQYMAPNVFTSQEYDYIQTHLRILSGFYGVLCPFDGVTPYRLEMQTKLKARKVNNLYSMNHGSVIMNIEKMVEIGLLFEQYKELLTDKQREIVSLYNEEDYSLGEISENINVSRQGVYDTLKRSEKILKDYENKLHLVEKIQEQEKITKTIIDKIVDIKQDLLQNRDCANLIHKIENIEDICMEMLK